MKIVFNLLFLAILFSTCKYEDGPKLSLRTKKHRLVNNWHFDKYFENGVDKTDIFLHQMNNYSYSVDFNSDNTYKITEIWGQTKSETGTWEFIIDKNYINFMSNNSNEEYKWKILRLTEKEIWFEYDLNNNHIERHLKE